MTHSLNSTITHTKDTQIWQNIEGESEPLVGKTKAELIQLNSDIQTCRIVFKHYNQKTYWLKRIQAEYDSRKKN